MNSFQTALAHVFAQEGGYVDHPNDPGGATKYGITRRTLARYRNVRPTNNLPKSAVRHLRKSEATKIYYRYYWNPNSRFTIAARLGVLSVRFCREFGTSPRN